MNPRFTSETTHTIVVCHSNRNLVRMAQMQASRHGVRLIVARDGRDIIAKATGQIRPDAIILSDDLKNPSTEETVRSIKLDPRLQGVQVVVLKGMLGNIAALLKGFRPPWNLSAR